MRRLRGLFERARRPGAPLSLTERDVRTPVASATAARTAPRPDLKALSAEIEQVANYVFRLRREISALRPGSIAQDEVPSIREDLTSVETEVRSATDRIMRAAETLLSSAQALPDEARRAFDANLTAILEACSFQDLAGQRLARATVRLTQLEKRIERFIRTVNVPDAAIVFDRDAIVRTVRREMLLVEGPQAAGDAIDQDGVDKLFG